MPQMLFLMLRQEFFRAGGKTLNFIITRSAHLSYKYTEVLSHWALKKYPEYRGMTGNEETDCALVKARLVDDLFQWLLMALEDEGKLEDTVIIGVTDHYTYGYKDMESLYDLSGTEEDLLLEKTPCFIWSADMEAMEVGKTLNTSDFLPTVLNLLGVDTPYTYLGQDAFDPDYTGYAIFSDGRWIANDIYCSGFVDGNPVIYSPFDLVISQEFVEEMTALCDKYVRVSNLLLTTDYYK